MPSPHAAEIVLTDAERASWRVGATAHQCGRSCVTRQDCVGRRRWWHNVELADRLELDRARCASGATGLSKIAATGCSMSLVRVGRGWSGDEQIEALITETLETTPPDATHWSTRSMAEHLGLSQSMVSRVWRAFGLAPHKQDSWKLSKDPLFVEKVRDVVGLYLDPPERALVLCVDEKTQIQALNRTQPVFPMLPGTPARASHDYVRHGTSSLYAALDLAPGQ